MNDEEIRKKLLRAIELHIKSIDILEKFLLQKGEKKYRLSGSMKILEPVKIQKGGRHETKRT